MKNLEKEKIVKYFEDLFEFDATVKTVELKPNENGVYVVEILATRLGNLIGRKGWILKMLTDNISMKFGKRIEIKLLDMSKYDPFKVHENE